MEEESGPSGSAGASPAAGAASPPPPARHGRTSSFQRWRRQMQRAWRWGPVPSREQGQGWRASLNLELMANQKRQWYQAQSKAKDLRTSPFEEGATDVDRTWLEVTEQQQSTKPSGRLDGVVRSTG